MSQSSLLHQFIPLQYQHTPLFEKARLKVVSARTGLPSYLRHVYSEPLWIMQGLVTLVLLLCCVNVGGLMAAKVYARSQEFAVRRAIGAANWRLIRQCLIEAFLVAFTGALFGAAIAWYGTPALLHFFREPMMSEPMSIQPDPAAFWMTGVCAISTTLLLGMLSAWRVSKVEAGALLVSRTVVGARRHIAGRTFVPTQVCISVVLVALAALLSKSLILLRGEPTGFELDHVTIQTPPVTILPKRGNAKLDLYQRMVDRIGQMPGVRAAAVTFYTPLTGFESTAHFQAIDSHPSPREDFHMAYNSVGPGYFRTMGTAIIEGREFEKPERSLNACILNRSAATYLFPDEQALGRHVQGEKVDDLLDAKSLSCRVIGIAEDAKFASLREPSPRTIYFPVSTNLIGDGGNLVFLINSATSAQAISGYRKALSEIAPTLPLVLFVTLRDQMDAALGSQRLITALSNCFAGLALMLSAVGLYGLLSSSVMQRRSEIGVRMALGASRARVLWMVLSEAVGLLSVGLVFGSAGLLVAVRTVRGMLFDTSTFDPVVVSAVFVALLTITVTAAMSPALRASSVDPVRALRTE